MTEHTTPRDRSENEIAGYRDVLNTIHASYDYIPWILRQERDEGRRECIGRGVDARWRKLRS